MTRFWNKSDDNPSDVSAFSNAKWKLINNNGSLYSTKIKVNYRRIDVKLDNPFVDIF